MQVNYEFHEKLTPEIGASARRGVPDGTRVGAHDLGAPGAADA